MRPRRGGTPLFELILYLVAGCAYIATGFIAKEVFAWWSYGAIWLVAIVWFVPKLWRRDGADNGDAGANPDETAE